MRQENVITALAWLVAITLTGCGNSAERARIDSIVVEVTGTDFNWYFRYPGPDGQLGTDDDKQSIQNLYLPDNASVSLELNSSDYVYTIGIPLLGLKEIAVPDLNYSLEFNTATAQTWELLGDQMCGYSHKNLIGKVFIVDQAEGNFYDWADG